jgi:CHAD domain-containing protein
VTGTLPPPAAALDRHATVEDLVRSVLANGAGRLVEADPVVRTGKDPEGVHQARVATRRLRSDLRTLRPLVERSWSEHLRDELRWIGGLLGRVRDADVLGRLLEEHAATLRPGQHARATSLIRELDHRRADDRTTLLDAMNSTRYHDLLEQLEAAAARPRLSEADGGESPKAARVADRLVRKAWKRLHRQVERIPVDAPSDAELHEVRKRAKRARYALEAVAPIVGKSASRTARRLESLQDVLGEHQDAVVAAAWIEAAAERSTDVETAFVAGELAETFAASRRRTRDEWTREWRKARRARHAMS